MPDHTMDPKGVVRRVNCDSRCMIGGSCGAGDEGEGLARHGSLSIAPRGTTTSAVEHRSRQYLMKSNAVRARDDVKAHRRAGKRGPTGQRLPIVSIICAARTDCAAWSRCSIGRRVDRARLLYAALSIPF